MKNALFILFMGCFHLMEFGNTNFFSWINAVFPNHGIALFVMMSSVKRKMLTKNNTLQRANVTEMWVLKTARIWLEQLDHGHTTDANYYDDTNTFPKRYLCVDKSE